MDESIRISLKRNNDRNFNITVKKHGTVQNITGWEIYFAVKKTPSDPDTDAIIEKHITVHTDPVNGESTIPLLAADTATKDIGTYYYDILVIDGQGKRQSSLTGAFQLLQEVTDGS